MASFTYKGVMDFDLPDDWSDEQLHKFVKENEKHLDVKAGLKEAEKPKEASGIGDFVRGVKDTGALIRHGVPFVAKAAFGNEEGARESAAAYQKSIAENEAENPRAFKGDITDISGVGDAYHFARQAVMEMAPSMLVSLGTAGIGSMLAKKMVAAGVEKAIASGIAKEVAEEATKRAAQKGIVAGAVAGSGVLNIPESTMGMAEETKDTGSLNFGAGLAAGAVKTALDSFTPILMLRRAKGDAVANSVIDKILEKVGYKGESLAGRVGAGALEGSLSEGGTEGAQEAADRLAVDIVKGNPDFFRKENIDKIVTAAAMGAIGGGVFGGTAGLVAGKKQDEEKPTTETADIQLTKMASQEFEGSLDDKIEIAFSALNRSLERTTGKPVDPRAQQQLQDILASKDEEAKQQYLNQLNQGLETASAKDQKQRDFATKVMEAEQAKGGVTSFELNKDNTYLKDAKKEGLTEEEARHALRQHGFTEIPIKNKKDEVVGYQYFPYKNDEATPNYRGEDSSQYKDGTWIPNAPKGTFGDNQDLSSSPAGITSQGSYTLIDSEKGLADAISDGRFLKDEEWASVTDKKGNISIPKIQKLLKGKGTSRTITQIKQALDQSATIEKKDGRYRKKEPFDKIVEEQTTTPAATSNEVTTTPAAPAVKQETPTPPAPAEKTSSPPQGEQQKPGRDPAKIIAEANAYGPVIDIRVEEIPRLKKLLDELKGLDPEKLTDTQKKYREILLDDLQRKVDSFGKQNDNRSRGQKRNDTLAAKTSDLTGYDNQQKKKFAAEIEGKSIGFILNRLRSLKVKLQQADGPGYFEALKEAFAENPTWEMEPEFKSLYNAMKDKANKEHVRRANGTSTVKPEISRPENMSQGQFQRAKTLKEALTGKTLREAAETMAIIAENGFVRGIFQRISTFVRAMENAGFVFDFQITDKLGSSDGKPYLGEMSQKGNTITVKIRDLIDSRTGLRDSTLLHEMLHAITASAIDVANSSIADTLPARFKDFNEAITKLRLEAESIYESENGPEEKPYMFENNHEFISEAFSNQKAKVFLRNIRNTLRGVWDAIRNLLGLPESYRNAFDFADDALKSLEEANEGELKQLLALSSQLTTRKKPQLSMASNPKETINEISFFSKWLNSTMRIGEKSGGPTARFSRNIIDMFREKSRIAAEFMQDIVPYSLLEQGERIKAALVLYAAAGNKEALKRNADGSYTVVAKNPIFNAGVKKGDILTVSGKTADAVAAVDAAMDKVWNLRNGLLKANAPRNGYIPFVFDGDFHIVVKKGDEIVHTEGVDLTPYRDKFNWLTKRESSKAKADATIERLRQAYPGHYVDDQANPAHVRIPMNGMGRTNMLLALKGKLTAGSQDPLNAKFEGAINDSVLDSLRKHYFNVNKKYVDGYIRNGETADQALAHALGQFVEEASNGIARLKYQSEIFRAREDMKNALDARGSKGSNVLDWANKLINYLQSSEEEWAFARTLAFHGLLGGNIASAFTQTFQVHMNTVPVIAGFSGAGRRAYGSWWNAQKKAKLVISVLPTKMENGKPAIDWDTLENHGLDPAKLAKLPEADRKVIEKLKNEGALSNVSLANMIARNKFDTSHGAFVNNKLVQNLMNVSGYAFGLAELNNRLTTYYMVQDMMSDKTFAKNMEILHKQSLWKDEPMDAHMAGRLIMDYTQFEMMRANRADIFRGFRAVPTQFMGWAAMTFELYGRMISMAAGKDGRAAAGQTLAYMALALFITSGLMGMPFADNIDKFLLALSRFAPGLFKGDFSIRYEIEKLIAENLGENYVATMMRGPLSAISGVNFAGRLGMGDLLKLDVLSGNITGSAGPAVSMVTDRMVRAGREISEGQFGPAIFHALMPQAIINLNEGLRAVKPLHENVFSPIDRASESLGLGKEEAFGGFRTRSGNVRVSPEHMGMEDAALKTLGFQSSDMAHLAEEMTRQNFEQNKFKALKGMHYQHIYKDAVNSVLSDMQGNSEAGNRFRQRMQKSMKDLQEYNNEAPFGEKIKIDMNRLRRKAYLEAHGEYIDMRMKFSDKQTIARLRPLREKLARELQAMGND